MVWQCGRLNRMNQRVLTQDLRGWEYNMEYYDIDIAMITDWAFPTDQIKADSTDTDHQMLLVPDPLSSSRYFNNLRFSIDSPH
jgi:hypothetical protein